MGKSHSCAMLQHGLKPTAQQALDMRLISRVVPHDRLLLDAQSLAEQWVASGRRRSIPCGGSSEEYCRVNAHESRQLADAFLSIPFLTAQQRCAYVLRSAVFQCSFRVIMRLVGSWRKRGSGARRQCFGRCAPRSHCGQSCCGIDCCVGNKPPTNICGK